MTSLPLNLLLDLRHLVGFLGEKTQFGWWPTSFFDRSSHQFLSPIFARTLYLAQRRGIDEAARRVHDEHLNVGSYHLFRLPEEVEQDLHNFIHEQGFRSAANLQELTTTGALQSLSALAGDARGSSIGPISIGEIGDIRSPHAHSKMAAEYFSAFDKQVLVYPYFADR